MSTDNILRMTSQRQVILNELRRMTSHPTADEVYQKIRQRLPRISLGTVYRNLEILSECGLIQKLSLAGCQKRFDGNVENHCHVRCLQCGRVGDVHIDSAPALTVAARQASDFEIRGYSVEFTGFCPQCLSKE